MIKKSSYNCGFELTLELVGGKWKGLILWKLQEKGVLRYGELSREVKGITQKMPTQQLKQKFFLQMKVVSSPKQITLN